MGKHRYPMTPEHRAKIAAAQRGKKQSAERRQAQSERQRMPLDLELLRELAQQGLSTREIAPRLGCSEETVRRRMKELGLPRLPAKARPDRNHFWRGGRTQDKHGYWLVKVNDHPYATKGGYVREHRLVMEAVLGRYLRPGEVVDHIDGDTSNNDPSNLRVFASNADHLRATLTGKIPNWSPDGLRRIQEGLLHGRAVLRSIREGSETDAPPSP